MGPDHLGLVHAQSPGVLQRSGAPVAHGRCAQPRRRLPGWIGRPWDRVAPAITYRAGGLPHAVLGEPCFHLGEVLFFAWATLGERVAGLLGEFASTSALSSVGPQGRGRK